MDSENSEEYSPLTGKPRLFYGWYMVAASWVMLFLPNTVAVAIFFKPMLEEFGWDRATFSSVQTVSLIVFAAILPFYSRLIDRFGPRTMILVSVASQTLTSVVNGLATNIWHLYLARFLYDIKVLLPAQVLTNRWFVKKRGLAQGILASSWTIGALIFSPLSQYLILMWGWRMTMFFWAGITLVITLPLALIIKDNPEDKGYSPDGEPLQRVNPIDPLSRQEKGVSEAKLGTVAGTSLSEAARTGAFWAICAASTICGIGCGFMMTHIVIFATDMGYSDMIGASFVSVQGGANLVGVLLTGHMSDRLAKNKVLAMTHLIRSISFVIVVIFILLGSGSLWILYVAMAIFGFGWFTTAPLRAGLVADLFGKVQMGTIIGVTVSCHTFGMAIGAYAGGAFFELTHSYYSLFVIQAILAFLAAILAFSIRRKALY